MAKTPKRFVQIGKTEMAGAHVYDILVDRDTRFQYVSMTAGTGGGSLTVLVDAQGKPLVYEGELD